MALSLLTTVFSLIGAVYLVSLAHPSLFMALFYVGRVPHEGTAGPRAIAGQRLKALVKIVLMIAGIGTILFQATHGIVAVIPWEWSYTFEDGSQAPLRTYLRWAFAVVGTMLLIGSNIEDRMETLQRLRREDDGRRNKRVDG